MVVIALTGCGGGGSSGADATPTAFLQQFDMTDRFRPVISGVPFSCIDRAGRPVAYFLDPNIHDIALSVPEAILLNPNRLGLMQRQLQYFWANHECAHHVFFSNDELAADCWSIATGKKQGLFNRRDVEGFEPLISALPASNVGHPPGPQRFQRMLVCYDAN